MEHFLLLSFHLPKEGKHTENQSPEKRKYVSTKTPLRFNQNASAFQVKRKYVCIKTQRRLLPNAKAFFSILKSLQKSTNFFRFSIFAVKSNELWNKLLN